jgi:hypothetical protein
MDIKVHLDLLCTHWFDTSLLKRKGLHLTAKTISLVDRTITEYRPVARTQYDYTNAAWNWRKGSRRLSRLTTCHSLRSPTLLLQLLREFRVPSHNPLSAAEQEEQFSHVLQPEAGFVGIDLPSKLPVVIGQERLDLLQGRLRRPKVGVMHVKAITDRQGCRRATAEPPSGRALA